MTPEKSQIDWRNPVKAFVAQVDLMIDGGKDADLGSVIREEKRAEIKANLRELVKKIVAPEKIEGLLPEEIARTIRTEILNFLVTNNILQRKLTEIPVGRETLEREAFVLPRSKVVAARAIDNSKRFDVFTEDDKDLIKEIIFRNSQHATAAREISTLFNDNKLALARKIVHMAFNEIVWKEIQKK